MNDEFEVQVSDLFQHHGKKFDWEQRISEQELFVSRLREANKNIYDPNAVSISRVTDEFDEFSQGHIASGNFREFVFDKLRSLGVVLT